MDEIRKRIPADKKLIIYGTGVVAKRVTGRFPEQVVGVLDRDKTEGTFSGFPILTWDALSRGKADFLVIAAGRRNLREIFFRIRYRCQYLKLTVVDEYGMAVEDLYTEECLSRNDARYLMSVDADALRKEIERHDVICFDLFDTLIMRKVWQPQDIFDLVEESLKEAGIFLPQYKEKRRMAERLSGGGDIDKIYRILQEEWGLDDATRQFILETEIELEKRHIVPREEMVRIFQEAVAANKRVCIVSDMYLNETLLKSIIEPLGIEGYEALFVSCDHKGKGKTRGLFDVVKERLPGTRYLHIGDNPWLDGVSAKRHGMDFFHVKSAVDLFRVSELRGLLMYEHLPCFRRHMGAVIATLLNSPFCLHHTTGMPAVQTSRMVAGFFYVPVVTAYFQALKTYVSRHAYEGLLFGMRDGFLFEKIYDELAKLDDAWASIAERTPFYYFALSRKLAFRAATRTQEDLSLILAFLEETGATNADELLCNIFGEGASMENEEYMLQQAHTARGRYQRYLEKKGIRLDGNYLFCECIAVGNQHDAFNRFCQRSMPGFYFHQKPFTGRMKHLDVHMVTTNPYGRDMGQIYPVLEVLLTAPTPSVMDVDEDGEIVYDKESRSDREIQFVSDVQKHIADGVLEWNRKGDLTMDADYALDLLGHWNHMRYMDGAQPVNEMLHLDDMTGTWRPIQR